MVFKALVCLALFCGTDLLKTLAAKSLARTFHKEAHFAKMQDALEKVLPKPRSLAPACACTWVEPLILIMGPRILCEDLHVGWH